MTSSSVVLARQKSWIASARLVEHDDGAPDRECEAREMMSQALNPIIEGVALALAAIRGIRQPVDRDREGIGLAWRAPRLTLERMEQP